MAEVWAASRTGLHHYHNSDGRLLDCTSNDEYLNLKALGKLWRAEWAQIPTEAAAEVCFNLTLPNKPGEDVEEFLVHWEWTMPPSDGVGIITQDDFNLIVLLSTTLKLRAGGSSIIFTLHVGGNERMPASSVANIEEKLGCLSMYRRDKELDYVDENSTATP